MCPDLDLSVLLPDERPSALQRNDCDVHVDDQVVLAMHDSSVSHASAEAEGSALHLPSYRTGARKGTSCRRMSSGLLPFSAMPPKASLYRRRTPMWTQAWATWSLNDATLLAVIPACVSSAPGTMGTGSQFRHVAQAVTDEP